MRRRPYERAECQALVAAFVYSGTEPAHRGTSSDFQRRQDFSLAHPNPLFLVILAFPHLLTNTAPGFLVTPSPALERLRPAAGRPRRLGRLASVSLSHGCPVALWPDIHIPLLISTWMQRSHVPHSWRFVVLSRPLLWWITSPRADRALLLCSLHFYSLVGRRGCVFGQTL